MRFKTFCAVSAITFATVTGAQAADVVVHNTVPVVVVPSFSWSGFYVGAQAGYSWTRDKNEYHYGTDTQTTYYSDPYGWMGGVYAGFNSDFFRTAVVGVETDFAWSDYYRDWRKDVGSGTPEGVVTNPPAPGTPVISPTPTTVNWEMVGRSRVHWNGATRVRVGYSADRVMPYIAGGVAYTGVGTETYVQYKPVTMTDPDTVPTEAAREKTNYTMVGWTVGAGIDYATTDNVVMRVEYRYNDYGRKDTKAEGIKHRKTFSSNDIRVGIAYKF